MLYFFMGKLVLFNVGSFEFDTPPSKEILPVLIFIQQVRI